MAGAGKKDACGDESLAKSVFSELRNDDPLFVKLKDLLLHGRRAEAVNLICTNDTRFGGTEAQELVSLIMGTLRDTMIDP